MARFVETFARVLGDPALPHLFFVDGGALAVENALKVAFDWKSRLQRGARARPGAGHQGAAPGEGLPRPQRLHDEPHQHRPEQGRPLPEVRLAAHPVAVDQRPRRRRGRRGAGARRGAGGVRGQPATTSPASSPSRSRARAATTTSARSSCRRCSALCREFDALFVMDEVQTGVGMTGTAWAYQQLGVRARRRRVRQEGPGLRRHGRRPGRRGPGQRLRRRRRGSTPPGVATSPTWCGPRRILEVIERDEAHRPRGLRRHPPARSGLEALAEKHPQMRDVRGRGLMCAFTLPTPAERDEIVTRLREDERVLVLGCGATCAAGASGADGVGRRDRRRPRRARPGAVPPLRSVGCVSPAHA